VDCASRFVPIRDGRRIHVLQAGPVHLGHWILIHGYGEGAYVWREVIRSRPPTSSMIAIDLAGHGQSCRQPDASYTTVQAVDDVIDVVNTLGLQKFCLIGHSWGGAIALHVAGRLGDRVAGVVVVDTGMDENPEAMERVRQELSLSLKTYRSVEEYAAWMIERRPLAAPEIIRRLAADALHRRADELFELRVDPAFRDAWPPGGWNLRPILGNIQASVLLVRGAVSGVVSPQIAQKMVRHLRRCRLQTVPKAGHAVMIDNPCSFISTIDPFLRDISQGLGA
jgi:pimeloyl-ACP methyl ester carboxylesterase